MLSAGRQRRRSPGRGRAWWASPFGSASPEPKGKARATQHRGRGGRRGAGVPLSRPGGGLPRRLAEPTARTTVPNGPIGRSRIDARHSVPPIGRRRLRVSPRPRELFRGPPRRRQGSRSPTGWRHSVAGSPPGLLGDLRARCEVGQVVSHLPGTPRSYCRGAGGGRSRQGEPLTRARRPCRAAGSMWRHPTGAALRSPGSITVGPRP